MDLREQLQATLGQAYIVGRELGGGGMSRVFLAEDTRLGRTVVVKVLAPDLAAGISAERFEREIRMVAALQQANIVPLLTAGDTNGLPFFTMPYVDGESLRARLASGTPLPLAECLSILRDVTRALSYAHQHGVVHRDIKPDNILLSHGAAEVTDFGIAKALDAARLPESNVTLTQIGTSVGTAAYMSPEQAAADPGLDHRTDIYSVGVVAYELLSGHLPFVGTPQAIMAAHISATPAPITNRAELPPALARAVMKCLAKDPAARYQSADALLADIEASGGVSAGVPPRRVLAWAVGVLAIAAIAWFGSSGLRQKRWVHLEAIPHIKAYLDIAQADSAWLLARQVEAILPNDTTMSNLWPRIALKAVLRSEPSGARVYRASLGDSTHWILLGTTPTDSLRLPSERGVFGLVRVEKPGYRPFRGLMGAGSRTFILDSVGAADSGMVHVPAGTFSVFLVGLDGRPQLKMGDYLMDRHEVSNRQFKEFVDAGGYTKREYWPAEFQSGAKKLSWDAAISQFKDKTGRLGPASWEAGSFPNGRGDYPVSGVSWYEASAYAKFAGKSLPTIYHWARVAGIYAASYIAPRSNLGSAGPLPVNTLRGISAYGVSDLAGNVREWCENGAGGDERYILGGGWTDSPYGFTDGYAQAAMDRSAINGIRLVRYLHEEPALAQARLPQLRAYRDYAQEKPVPDAVFDGYRHVYDYDHRPLNAKIESRDTTQEEWNMERVSFDAAYGGERVGAVILLPKHPNGPLQPIVQYQGSGVIFEDHVTRSDLVLEFLAQNGRAFILPILKSTFERRDSLTSDLPDSSIFWRQHVIMWVQDIQRTLDYLSTRPDMDTTRFGYFGFSWGSNMAPINLAVDQRFKAAVLYVAGLTMERGRPEVDPLNFLPRVKQPVLMLNGKYDFFFPLELAQKPFFQLLGTPAEQKKWIVYEGGHDVPRTALISETLAWFDKYLGPVR